MATKTELINPKVTSAPDSIRDKHFYRKHGANAYYGQEEDSLKWKIEEA